MIAESAFLCGVGFGIDEAAAVGTGLDTVAAAKAIAFVDQHDAIGRYKGGADGADLGAGRIHTVVAQLGYEEILAVAGFVGGKSLLAAVGRFNFGAFNLPVRDVVALNLDKRLPAESGADLPDVGDRELAREDHAGETELLEIVHLLGGRGRRLRACVERDLRRWQLAAEGNESVALIAARPASEGPLTAIHRAVRQGLQTILPADRTAILARTRLVFDTPALRARITACVRSTTWSLLYIFERWLRMVLCPNTSISAIS